MIKLFCDMCTNEVNKLHSIQTKVEYVGDIEIGVDVNSMFVDMKKDHINKKTICETCKNLLMKNALEKFNEINSLRRKSNSI